MTDSPGDDGETGDQDQPRLHGVVVVVPVGTVLVTVVDGNGAVAAAPATTPVARGSRAPEIAALVLLLLPQFRLAGVDLLPCRDGKLYAIEVNAVPGWQALSRTLKIDVAALVLDYLERALS